MAPEGEEVTCLALTHSLAVVIVAVDAMLQIFYKHEMRAQLHFQQCRITQEPADMILLIQPLRNLICIGPCIIFCRNVTTVCFGKN